MKWVIEDWAGNVKFNHKTFDSYQAGWSFLYGRFTRDIDLQEFSVVEREVRQ